jgi:hypothetical protein
LFKEVFGEKSGRGRGKSHGGLEGRVYLGGYEEDDKRHLCFWGF